MEKKTSQALADVRYIPALDGLRALCVAAVILNHTAGPAAFNDRVSLLIHYLGARGWLGVDVFFVLSGFLITWILSVELESSSTIDLRRFYLRRALRIQPAYFSGLALSFLFVFWTARSHLGEMVVTLPYFLTYTLNLALAWAILPEHVRYGQAWSLCIEEQFYFLWPVTLRALGKRAWRYLLVAIGAVMTWRSLVFCWFHWSSAGSGAAFRYVYFATDTRIDTILVGWAAAVALRNAAFAHFWKRVAAIPGFTILAATVVVALIAWCTQHDPIEGPNGSWRLWTFGSTLIGINVALLISGLVLQPSSCLARLLSLRPLVFIGKVSYGMHLFHFVVYTVVFHFIHQRPGFYRTPFAVPFFFALVLSGSIAVAWLHYVVIEKRCLALRAKLDKKRTPQLEAGPLADASGSVGS